MRTISILLPLALALALLATGCTVPAAGGTTEPAEPTTFAEVTSATTQPMTEPTVDEPTTPPSAEPPTVEPTTAAETISPLAPDTTRAVEPEPVAVSAYSGDLPEEVRNLPIFEREMLFGAEMYMNPFWQDVGARSYPDDFIMSIVDAEDLSLRVKSPATGDQAHRAFYEVTDIYYKGMTIHCSTPLGFYSHGFMAWRSDNLIVLGNGAWIDAVGRLYFLTDSGVEYMENHHSTDGYELYFVPGVDGGIAYNKMSSTFMNAVQAIDYMVESYVSEDQFFNEHGVVETTKDEVKFTPTQYWTINDWFVNVFLPKLAGENEPDYGAKTMGEFVEKHKQVHGRG